MAEEGAGTSSTSCEDVTQGSLSSSGTSSGTTPNRYAPLSKSDLGVGLEGNDVLAKTRERDPLEVKAEYHLSQVQVLFHFCFIFINNQCNDLECRKIA